MATQKHRINSRSHEFSVPLCMGCFHWKHASLLANQDDTTSCTTCICKHCASGAGFKIACKVTSPVKARHLNLCAMGSVRPWVYKARCHKGCRANSGSEREAASF
mmetsp:Transcript_63279/g.159581  ORF Transcript_63279/g.159581 Transcript_63279/m.159581 type:complete len:105 (+) Transcript_63279:71-385(+)